MPVKYLSGGSDCRRHCCKFRPQTNPAKLRLQIGMEIFHTAPSSPCRGPSSPSHWSSPATSDSSHWSRPPAAGDKAGPRALAVIITVVVVVVEVVTVKNRLNSFLVSWPMEALKSFSELK